MTTYGATPIRAIPVATVRRKYATGVELMTLSFVLNDPPIIERIAL
jgi:hypothetical protein